MGDKEKALQDAGEAYEELREAVDGLDEAQSRAVWLGTWGARDSHSHRGLGPRNGSGIRTDRAGRASVSGGRL